MMVEKGFVISLSPSAALHSQVYMDDHKSAIKCGWNRPPLRVLNTRRIKLVQTIMDYCVSYSPLYTPQQQDKDVYLYINGTSSFVEQPFSLCPHDSLFFKPVLTVMEAISFEIFQMLFPELFLLTFSWICENQLRSIAAAIERQYALWVTNTFQIHPSQFIPRSQIRFQSSNTKLDDFKTTSRRRRHLAFVVRQHKNISQQKYLIGWYPHLLVELFEIANISNSTSKFTRWFLLLFHFH